MWLCSSSLVRSRTDGLTVGGRWTVASPRAASEPKASPTMSLTCGVLEIAGGRHDHVRRHVRAAEIVAQRVAGEGLDRLLRAEDGPAERMPFPEMLREELVHEIVGRVLDHLDLFEDHLLLAADFFLDKRRAHHDVRQQVDGERQVLVEHFDVVAGVLLRGERVELSADRVDRLRDVFGRPGVGAFEEHVLDEMRDAALRVRLVPRPARQPHADRHRADLRHRLGDEPETIVEHLADDHRRGRIEL